MPQVPINKISWPTREAFVRDVHPAIMRLGLGPTAASILTAHIALSTGWGKAADNYRLAGIKASSEDQNYTVVSGTEYKNGIETPKTPMKWRSFNSLDEGVAAVVGLLRRECTPGRLGCYASSWAYLTAGSTDYFRQLGADGWYTAPPNVVAADCLARLAVINKLVGDTLPATGSAPGLLWLVAGFFLLRWWKNR